MNKITRGVVMLEDKLEELKRLGNYCVQVFYGEELGCDDIDIIQKDRTIMITAYPIGFLGEVRLLWKGNLKILKDFDFGKEILTKLSNPPERDEYKKNGYYIMGTVDGIKSYFKKVGSKLLK